MTRLCAVANTSSSTGPISRSGVTKPGTSALVESDSSRSTPSAPSRANAAQVGEPAVERQLVHLEVAGVQHEAGGRADRDRQRVGDRVVDREELAVERPELLPVALDDLQRVRLDAVLVSLASISARVSREPTSGMSGRSRSRYGTAPMWSSWPWVRTSASMSSRRSRM